MNKQGCIKQLETLRGHCAYWTWSEDVQALDMAIEELKKAAPEVPVQEQSVIHVNLDETFVKEVTDKISELNKLLSQNPKITTDCT